MSAIVLTISRVYPSWSEVFYGLAGKRVCQFKGKVYTLVYFVFALPLSNLPEVVKKWLQRLKH
jgi:hypothetical protein